MTECRPYTVRYIHYGLKMEGSIVVWRDPGENLFERAIYVHQLENAVIKSAIGWLGNAQYLQDDGCTWGSGYQG